LVLLLAAGLALRGLPALAGDGGPAPAADEPATKASSEMAVLAGGCFWGVQGVFQNVDGVLGAVSGYAGGGADTAHSAEVATGTTGHAEAVEVTFDPKRISYGRILQVFFAVAHDPTELNRQGPDFGSQYRSAIFPANKEQAHIAEAYIAQLGQAHIFPAAIVTRVEPGKQFFAAEAYHQNYLILHPSDPYIAINDMPKIATLKELFPNLYRAAPVLAVAAGGVN
jgi:peptide-methionine (S)-S-oxide reductase